jgi:hypothetical protein
MTATGVTHPNFLPRAGGGAAQRRVRAALAACLAAALLGSGCTTAPLQPGEAKIVREEPLAPYDAREECLRLVVGDRLDYEWTATRPVSFNIYYREGNAVLAPIVRERVTEDIGVFVPPMPQDYCLQWEAGPGGAMLDYRIRLRAVPR